MIELTTSLAEATSEVVRRVQRSLVVLHNGHHGVGAGIIWGNHPGNKRSDRSLILTNYHVIAHGRRLRAELEDGTEYPARLLAQAPEFDLALLEIDKGRLAGGINRRFAHPEGGRAGAGGRPPVGTAQRSHRRAGQRSEHRPNPRSQ